MSAAAPLPPPGPARGHAMNGYTNGMGTESYRDGNGANAGGFHRRGPYPPIAEISGSAAEKVNELRKLPIRSQLEKAKWHLRSAKGTLDSQRNYAAAYWEFLVAYDLVANTIPSHKDYIDRIEGSRGEMSRDFKQLQKEVRASESLFVNIKNIITSDNRTNGAQHRASQSLPRPSTATSIASSTSSNGVVSRRDDELMLPDMQSMPGLSTLLTQRPQVKPKPQTLHEQALHQRSASTNGPSGGDALAERFARLKMAAPPLDTTSVNTAHDLSVKMPSPSEYQGSSRPFGPRDMPPPPPRAPGHIPKLPLNTNVAASMPKEPSPTYSPARNLSQPESVNPPRSSARSMIGTGGRSNSMQASSAAPYTPHANGDTDSYFPPPTGPPPPRRKSTVKVTEDQIPVEKFYDYIRLYNVLVIDVRSREEFDNGHIYVRSIMCIEPATLQDGNSAEQLQDRLILSPDEEQAMFDRRNEYDLVIYYDDCTRTSDFLRKHNLNERETALRRLYTTLHEFNADNPLRQPPIFLMGGISAWSDLVGEQGLMLSSTTNVVATKQTRPRSIQRVTGATYAGKLNLQKRRLREYTPMDPEEEQQWIEEARKGRTVFDHTLTEEPEDDVSSSPLYHSTEEFLRRFPAVEIEQQSMMYPSSRPPPPQYAPPPIPTAPSRPAPSVSRTSYSGVHERQVAPQGRTSQPPVYVSRGRYGQIRHHKTGLLNFGVTCYMNSVVQCLCANTDLASIFLSNAYEKDLQKNNWKGTKGILPEAFATLLSNLFQGGVESVRPVTFRRVCGHFNSQWSIDEQQDAKEFLEFVLDHLHEDLNVTWNRTPLKQLSEAEELAREALPKPYVARIEWNRYLHRESSMIGNLFAGQHASRLTCMTCGTTSTTYEAFWSISVEIPHNRPADLRDCLRSYCSNERLSGDEVWRCPRCKRDREAMKKITITRAPDSLVVHFKRFSASHTQRAQKVRTPINFPLRGLDLGPFMEPPLSPEDEARVMAQARDAPAQLTGLRTDPAMNGPFIYNAYAVIWHIGGSIGSGHYIAHVKDKWRGCWRQFNDDRTVDYDPGMLPPENRLQNEKAYIVFYERERVASGAL